MSKSRQKLIEFVDNMHYCLASKYLYDEDNSYDDAKNDLEQRRKALNALNEYKSYLEEQQKIKYLEALRDEGVTYTDDMDDNLRKFLKIVNEYS